MCAAVAGCPLVPKMIIYHEAKYNTCIPPFLSLLSCPFRLLQKPIILVVYLLFLSFRPDIILRQRYSSPKKTSHRVFRRIAEKQRMH